MTKDEIRKKLFRELNKKFPSMDSNSRTRFINKIFLDYKDNEEQFLKNPNNLFNFLKAYIRHEYTHYEQLLQYGLNKKQCRQLIKNKIEHIFNALKKEPKIKKKEKPKIEPPKWRKKKKQEYEITEKEKEKKRRKRKRYKENKRKRRNTLKDSDSSVNT